MWTVLFLVAFGSVSYVAGDVVSNIAAQLQNLTTLTTELAVSLDKEIKLRRALDIEVQLKNDQTQYLLQTLPLVNSSLSLEIEKLKNSTYTCVRMEEKVEWMQNEVQKSLDNLSELKVIVYRVRDEFLNTSQLKASDGSSSSAGESEESPCPCCDASQCNNRISLIAAELQELNMTLADSLADFQSQLENVSISNTEHKEILNELSNMLKDKASVMFSASGGHINVSASSTLVFTTNHTNVGDAFDTYSGTFHVPVAGYYMFIASVQKTSQVIDTVKCWIKKNDDKFVLIYNVNVNRDNGSYDSATNSVIVFAEPGDRVLVGDCSGSSQTLGPGTTFSGFLLP